MKICHAGIYEAFERVRTSNMWPEKAKVWFDYHDGYHDKPDTHVFTISNKIGQAGVHRAHYLDELVKLLPTERAQFGKRLEKLDKTSNERWKLNFADGSSAEADAVIGCDGIKSKVRQLMYGKDHPCAYPTYTHKYAYRALATMEDAVKAVGGEKAQNACMHVSDQVVWWPYASILIDCDALDGPRRPCAHVPCQSRQDVERRCVSHYKERLA